MRIALFGATGRVGRLVLQKALDEGHLVTALVRDAARLPSHSGGVTIIEGAVEDGESVPATLAGAECAIVCLSAGHDTLHHFDEHALGTMERLGPHRIVSMVGTSVRLPGDPQGTMLATMTMIMRLAPGHLLADAEAHAARLAASGLDWTLVRSANHRDGPATGLVRAESAFAMRLDAHITRADLAAFLLDCATSNRFVCAAPMVENA